MQQVPRGNNVRYLRRRSEFPKDMPSRREAKAEGLNVQIGLDLHCIFCGTDFEATLPPQFAAAADCPECGRHQCCVSLFKDKDIDGPRVQRRRREVFAGTLPVTAEEKNG